MTIASKLAPPGSETWPRPRIIFCSVRTKILDRVPGERRANCTAEVEFAPQAFRKTPPEERSEPEPEELEPLELLSFFFFFFFFPFLPFLPSFFLGLVFSRRWAQSYV